MHIQYSWTYWATSAIYAHNTKNLAHIETYLDQFIGEVRMEDSVDPSPSWQIDGVYFVAWALDEFFKVSSQVLNWSRGQKHTDQKEQSPINNYKENKCVRTHIQNDWL